MGHSGKRTHRRKNFIQPTPKPLKNDFQNYALITKFHGGKTKHASVIAFDNDTDTCIPLNHLKLKGSLAPKKCRTVLAAGVFVILEYSEITCTLSYDQALQLIPPHIAVALAKTADIHSDDLVLDRERIADAQELSSDDDTDDTDDTIDPFQYPAVFTQSNQSADIDLI